MGSRFAASGAGKSARCLVKGYEFSDIDKNLLNIERLIRTYSRGTKKEGRRTKRAWCLRAFCWQLVRATGRSHITRRQG